MEVFCIHLPHRTDRMENINKLRKNYPSFNFILVNGIRDENGARGCLLSHQFIIRMAKQKKLPYVWVIEDDCTFLVTTGALITYARDITQAIADVDIVNGCGNLNDHTLSIVRRGADLTFLKSPSIGTTHCILYGASCYDKMLSYDDTHIADVITNECKMVFTYPYLATQLPSYSDIEKKDVVYENIRASASFVQTFLEKK